MAAQTNDVPVAIGRLLDALQLQAFVFTIEPKDGQWVLRVECATNGEWQTITLPLDGSRLSTQLRDPSQRERLMAQLRERLRTCAKTEGENPAPPRWKARAAGKVDEMNQQDKRREQESVELEIQQGQGRSIGLDERLKRAIRQHPQREPAVDSVEPDEAPKP